MPTDQILKYCSLKTQHLDGNCYSVTDMVEKPRIDQLFSNYAILGRCVLPAKIFPILEQLRPGAGGEIQLTDAMRELAVIEGMVGVEYEGVRYDMGNKLGILQAIVEVGLQHPEVGEDFRRYLAEVCTKYGICN